MEKQTVVTYEGFGAVGDGSHDDMEAIQKAHQFANENRLPVRAREGANYYIGGRALTAVVRTDTDWTGARITIDDRNVEDVKRPVFVVEGDREAYKLDLAFPEKGQKNLGRGLETDCLVTAEDSGTKKYIRFGLNVDNGTTQTDCFVVRRDGTIEDDIIWDFSALTSCTAHPMDETELTLRGGTFVTIANGAERVYNYYWRNIEVRRSHTVIRDLSHFNTEEGDSGSPYRGFLRIVDCAFVRVENCFFTGHRIYETIGRAGLPVSMGSYDIDVYRSSHVTFLRCRQDDIMDRTRWGLMGTNFCKNLVLDGCVFSRFDAHMGVTNAHLKNCRLGWQCLNAIGHGTFVVEDTEACGRAVINLREDYGSTWDGEMIIRNCVWYPLDRRACIINGSNSGRHDFGYVCKMPRKLTIERLRIMDDSLARDPEYQGPTVFGDYDPQICEADDGRQRPYPYETTEELHISGVVTESQKELRIRENPYSMPVLRDIFLATQ